MAKWSKTKDNIKAEVIEIKINTPDKKLREISEETDLPISTVADILKNDLLEVCKSSENVWKLIDINNNLQSLADERIAKMVKDWETSIRLSELVWLRESTFKQNQLIQQKPTEIVNVEANWAEILRDIQSGKIWKDEAYSLMQKMRE